jgi:antibiotic biosynthesis monooxygenase (ABM) superfamily enzyme
MDDTIHIAITRRVRQEHAAEFERMLAEFASRTISYPGSRGVHLLFPASRSESNEYGMLRSFASKAARDAFYSSAVYQDWTAQIEHLVEREPIFRKLDGLEAWFREPHAAMPPRWKMAVLTWIAVWPVSIAVPVAFAPFYGPSVPFVIQAGVGAAGIVLVLTWAAMPLLVKLAHPWLQGSFKRPALTPTTL